MNSTIYKVSWETQRGPGITYYRGIETIELDPGEDADIDQVEEWAINQVWRRGFTDFSRNHIKVIKIMSITPTNLLGIVGACGKP